MRIIIIVGMGILVGIGLLYPRELPGCGQNCTFEHFHCNNINPIQCTFCGFTFEGGCDAAPGFSCTDALWIYSCDEFSYSCGTYFKYTHSYLTDEEGRYVTCLYGPCLPPGDCGNSHSCSLSIL